MPDGVRKDNRAAQTLDVMWAMDSGGVSGRGRLLDLSISGACIEIDQPLPSGEGSMVSMMCSQVPALPSKAIVRWCRPLPGRQSAFLCGIRFVDTAIDRSRWNEWIAANL